MIDRITIGNKVRICYLTRCDNAGLAQSVERGTFNPEVKGSSPLFGDSFFRSTWHLIEFHKLNQWKYFIQTASDSFSLESKLFLRLFFNVLSSFEDSSHDVF